MLHLRSVLVIAGLTAAGCDKPQDAPRLHEEAVAAAQAYDARLDDLKRRADELDHRRAALPHDTVSSAAADHTLGQARSVLEDERGYLRNARARLQKPGTAAELRDVLRDLRRRVDDGITEASSELSAVESWVAIAERQRAAGEQRPAPPPPEPPTEDRAPETDRSGAPIR